MGNPPEFIRNFKKGLYQIDRENFLPHAHSLFTYQYKNNEPFRKYVDRLGRNDKFVFLPIRFFKSQVIKSWDFEPAAVFRSSGTTGQVNSLNLLGDPALYQTVSKIIFEAQVHTLKGLSVFALLPGYLERGESSLVYMVNSFIEGSGMPHSGFYLDDYGALETHINDSLAENRPTLLMGVTFALLDFGRKRDLHSDRLMVMETGGMKGRGKEMTRPELHYELGKLYGTKHIFSEYGMTELMSQAYCVDGKRFVPPEWMRVRIREVNDPFAECPDGKVGGINIIDLANIDTCAFIETQDLGMRHPDGSFEVLGRFDNADLRGCNLLIS